MKNDLFIFVTDVEPNPNNLKLLSIYSLVF